MGETVSNKVDRTPRQWGEIVGLRFENGGVVPGDQVTKMVTATIEWPSATVYICSIYCNGPFSLCSVVYKLLKQRCFLTIACSIFFRHYTLRFTRFIVVGLVNYKGILQPELKSENLSTVS